MALQHQMTQHLRQLSQGSQARGQVRPLRPALAPVRTHRRASSHIVCFSSPSLLPSRVVEKEKEMELQQLPYMENPVDDISLHNPLKRSERLSTSWFGVIMEYEGVVVQDTFEVHCQAWLKVAEEFGFPKPLGHVFRRLYGCRDDLVVSRIFKWTQNPSTAKQIARRKVAVYDELMGGRQPAEILEARPFLNLLQKYNIPIALACALPEARVKEDLKRYNLSQFFDAVITAEDSGAPEVEFSYSYAAQSISRPAIRCIVVGNSNNSVEAAHELGMKSVIVTGVRPSYDFLGADLVVRNLSQITLFNMKRLFATEEPVAPRSLEDLENDTEEEVDDPELDDFDSGPIPPVGFYRR